MSAKTSSNPTISDVARLADVSRTTVSHVLSGNPNSNIRVSDETRQRVLEAVEELGYVPNQSARSLRRRRTDRVCLVLPTLNAPLFQSLEQNLRQMAKLHNYTTIVTVAGSVEEEQDIWEQLRRQLADGVIIAAPYFLTEEDLKVLAEKGIAAVVFSNTLPASGFDIVRAAKTEAFEQAVDYLLKKGHSRIALLGSLTKDPFQQLITYRNILLNRGIPVDRSLFHGDILTRLEAYQRAEALLRSNDRPTAILTAGDIYAISAIWAARNMGLKIPRDVAIIGSGNIPEGEFMQPSLSTVGPTILDFSEVVDMLFSRLKRAVRSEGRVYQLPWKFMSRGSS